MNAFADNSDPGLLHHYVERAAASSPDQIASTYLDQSLTYADLDRRSSQLAQYLHLLGVERGDRVGIYMPKSMHTPIALYGILKAGAAYVPLDPSAPVERVAGLSRDCDIRCIISSSEQSRRLRPLSTSATPIRHVIGLDPVEGDDWQHVPWSDVEQQSGESVGVTLSADDIAYIIYTSGSTGTPKGIVHTHGSGLAFCRWTVDEMGFASTDRLSNHAPLHFDLSVMDYFSAAIAGATTVIVPEDYTKMPASYSQLIVDQGVTVLYTVPFALTQLLLRGELEHRDLSKLRYAIFGGEPFHAVYLRALMSKLPHVTFLNMYGPAEVNGVTLYAVTEPPQEGDSIPIGKPAGFAECVIVDAHDQPVQPGESGELLVSATSMMREYWQREELTLASLVRFDAEVGKTFYRTGDLVEELPDGNLRFVGRADRQVKVRGYRVELDEIEIALTSLDAVEEGAVYVIDVDDGVREVRAEVTLKIPGADVADLNRALKKSLPWYALPAQLQTRDEFPRTTTGKINRRRLQQDAQARFNDGQPG